MRTFLRRYFATLVFWFVVTASPAFGVSLMNGSVLSMNGLNLTVSNCTLSIPGWQQASCAAGVLTLQSVSGGRGQVMFALAVDPASYYTVQGGEYRLSFTMSAATNQPGSVVSSAALMVSAVGQSGLDIAANETFSAAAGGGSLGVDLLTGPSASTILAKAAAFSVTETMTLTSTRSWDPQTLRLSLTQTFVTSSEPAALTVLLTGFCGLALIRARRRAHDPRGAGGGAKAAQ